MRTDDFDYMLPDERIAQAPSEPRDACRLLVLHRRDGSIDHGVFTDIVKYVRAGDLLVANETRVMPARLVGRKASTGGVAETLLLTRREDLDSLGSLWECLVNPGKRLKPGAVIQYRAGGLHAPTGASPRLLGTVLDFMDGTKGSRLVRFEPAAGYTFGRAVHIVGHVPLPPYITEYTGDSEKYQTVYAMDEEHSAAAPTAGLHFTPELIQELRNQGVAWTTVELEVGFTLEQIDAIAPKPDELEDLNARLPLVEHAEHLLCVAQSARQALTGDAGVVDILASVTSDLHSAYTYDATLGEFISVLDSAMAEITDVSESLRTYCDTVEFDPQLLDELHARMASLQMLLRKYGPSMNAYCCGKRRLKKSLLL